jgi:Spy/CpxP family protein refolding chaperone
MNFRFLVTATVAAISISLFAQARPPAGGAAGGPGKPGQGGQMRGPGGGGMMRRGMPDELKKQLKITPDQQKKLDAIRKKYEPKFKAMFDANKGKMPDREKMRALFEASKKETDAVYTAKQKEILKKWRETHRRGMGGPGGPGRPVGPGGGSKTGTVSGAKGGGGKTGH